MTEKTIDPKLLEDALRKALQTLLPTSAETRASNLHDEFYNKFQIESKERDDYFRDIYGDDLDITLLFAALFSAISASFILAIQTQLQPDYSQLNYAVLMFIANSTFQKTPNLGVSPDKSIWTGPDSTIVHVQAVLFSSLAISLLAAFIAMLSKQWLSRYSESHGSPTERGRDRQRKVNGVTTWHFNLIMECLPLLLQAALLLFSYALSIYLSTINKTIAAVTIGFTSFGLLFYFLIVSAATLSYNCPFQTPLSLLLRLLFHLQDKDKNYLSQAWSWLKHMPLGGPRRSGRPHGLEGDHGDHVELAMVRPFGKPHRLAAGLISWSDYVLDTQCIAWLYQRSRSAEVVMAIAGLIPEIIWHADMGISPLKQLYDILLECFDSSSEPPALIPKLREKAYLSAKALVHLAVQRKHIESDRDVFRSISVKHRLIGSRHYDTDSDLESTLGMVDRVFKDGDLPLMRWGQFSFTVPHQTWMGYTLRFHTWHPHRNNDPLSSDAEEFVLHSLQRVTPPPTPIVVECLHIIGHVLGITFEDYNQQPIDENRRISSQIDSIYNKLERVWDNNSTEDEIAHALKAMKLIAPLSRSDVAAKSYRLFGTVMRTPVTATHYRKKWEASRHALHGAYKGNDLPWADNAQDIFTFLIYHFELALEGEIKDEPIQDSLRALAYASDPATVKASFRFHLAEPSFVRGIRFTFKADQPLKIREMALFLLPLIGDTWFDAAPEIIPGEIESFCVDWATLVDGIKLTSNAQMAILTTLFHMMDSPHWRPHIPEGKWKLLEYYPSLPDDYPPLKRCLKHPQLVAAISGVADPDAIIPWAKILWLNYSKLADTVKEALEKVTKAAPRGHIDTYYLEAVAAELEKVEEARMKYTTWSSERTAIALDEKIADHEEAMDALKSIKRQQ